MIKTDLQLITGKTKKGDEFKALKFIVKTPLGNYESGLNFPTPMEMSIIEKYMDSDASDISSIYSGDTSPVEGF